MRHSIDPFSIPRAPRPEGDSAEEFTSDPDHQDTC